MRLEMHAAAVRQMHESATHYAHESACVVFDIDGTLVDVSRLLYLVPDSLTEFHARAESEGVGIKDTINTACRFYDEGTTVIVLTARGEEWRDSTMRLLLRLGVRFTHLQMRADGDLRDDVAVKRDGIYALRAQGFSPYAAWEDKPEVAEMLNAEGLTVTIVTA